MAIIRLDEVTIRRPNATAGDLAAIDITDYDDGVLGEVTSLGLFQYNSTSTATADNVTVIQPLAGSGRWLVVKPTFSATNVLLGRSTAGAGVAEEIPCTAAGRALIAGANAAAQLTTLGAVPLAGGTLTGAIVNYTATPTLDLELVPKSYVDAFIAGLNFQTACVVATTANLTATYANGAAGVGATLTNSGALAAFSSDGQTPALNSRVLVSFQSSTLQNGIYVLTTVGSGAVAWVLTRASDYNQPSEIQAGDALFVNTGTLYGGSLWYETATVTTIGTDPIVFALNNSAANISVTAPLTKTGNTIALTTPLGSQYGGTDNSSYAIGDILYASGATTLSKLADIATGNALISGGVATAPSWGKIGLTTHVSGVLPVANGGTNASSASITAFNNITGYTAAGATGTTSTNLVFSTSPTLVTPALGVATATSINKVAITAPATSATLTLADGSSLITSGAFASTFTFTNTTGVTFPTSGTLATTSQLYTGNLSVSVRNVLFDASTNYTYSNGTLGVGATLTHTSNGALVADGITNSVGDLILALLTTTSAQGGIYSVTDAGSAGTPYILTRVTNFDTAAEMLYGTRVNVSQGTSWAGVNFTLYNSITTVGTTAFQWDITGQMVGDFGIKTANVLNNFGDFNVSAGRLSIHGGTTVPSAIGPELSNSALEVYNIVNKYGIVTFDSTSAGIWGTYAGTEAWMGSIANVAVRFFVNGGTGGPSTSVGHFTTAGTFGVGTFASPPFSVTSAGVISGVSLATSAATPLLLTNGQLVNIALTSQTSGATTLTIPDFAGVVDEFTFKTKSQSMSNKTLVSPVISTGLTASGSAANDFSASTGTFLTSTGANTLNGAVTVNDATTPSITLAAGKTNTGFFQVNGKTSGALKIIAADAAAQTVTLSLAAQTVGAATLTIPNMANTNKTVAWLESPVFTGTVTIPTPFTLGATSVTSTGTQLNYLNAATGTTGTTSTNVVFSTSPTLVTPLLGTPTSGTLTNCTGYPVANIANLGANVATFLATPSSANFAAAVTGETGSGAVVFGTLPTFTGFTSTVTTGNIAVFNGTMVDTGTVLPVKVEPTIAGAGAVSEVQVLRCAPTFNAAGGTIARANALYSAPTWTGSGTITELNGLLIDAVTGSGATVTSAYGLQCLAPTAGATRYTASFSSGVGIGGVNAIATDRPALGIYTANAINTEFSGTQTALVGATDQYALRIIPTFAPTAGATNIQVIRSVPTLNAAGGTITNASNYYGFPLIGASGTISTFYGMWLQNGSTSGATVTTATNLRVEVPNFGATKYTAYFDNVVCIGGLSTTYALYVSTDSAGKPGVGGTWTVVSDQRIKTNIIDVEDALEKLNALRVREFEYTPEFCDAFNFGHGKKQYGFIAQEYETVFPDDVSTQDKQVGDTVIENCKEINTGQTSALVIRAIQQLSARLDALEGIS